MSKCKKTFHTVKNHSQNVYSNRSLIAIAVRSVAYETPTEPFRYDIAADCAHFAG